MPRPSWLAPLWEPVSISLGGFVTLTNVGSSYDSTNASRGLGCVQVDMTNVTRIDLIVRVNKVGTGTQDWQLWNETDGTEVGVISDDGGTGLKDLTAAFTGLALTGLKRLRVRARSSTSTDDPVYLGSCILLS